MTLFVSASSFEIGNNCLTQSGGAKSDQVSCSEKKATRQMVSIVRGTERAKYAGKQNFHRKQTA